MEKSPAPAASSSVVPITTLTRRKRATGSPAAKEAGSSKVAPPVSFR